MVWCELADVLAVVPEADVLALVDDEGAGSLDGARLARVETAIAEAGTLVAAYVADLVTASDQAPAILRLKSRDLAVYNLYRRRFPTEMPESVTRDYKEAVRLLEAVRDGRLKIGEQATPGPGVYRTNKTRQDRQFGDDMLKRFTG